MSTLEEAKNLARRLHAYGGGPEVVRKAAARELARRPPDEAVQLVHALQLLAREGWEPATCVLGAAMAALGQETESLPAPEVLEQSAGAQALPEVTVLFTRAPARQELDPRAAAKADARLFSMPLGHLKQQARLTRDPDELARLATASNAAVVRNALINPRLTEALVVRMAARRPARPEPLVEIWKSSRWSTRHAVRRALVFNPYLPPEVGAKIVPLLNASDLEELVADNSLHAALREQARLLLAHARAGGAR
ncbi:hypothetical protein FGE12_20080 [Aggregicoccus sp. 17bor-14]|uniref:hypothetical protein n=1 Tax=Myxococcaceae TaxID=31 RepID=UPI00129CAD85|nr:MULTISPECIES: hypothetical protein [Myxococcaceae]MBF5044710.1 hypothetical protein [Simulacricoccus sp. 17bor-14]MRI90454.1 hypothetical protein [Aggregicoccus sp. 17bor-14]